MLEVKGHEYRVPVLLLWLHLEDSRSLEPRLRFGSKCGLQLRHAFTHKKWKQLFWAETWEACEQSAHTRSSGNVGTPSSDEDRNLMNAENQGLEHYCSDHEGG